MEERFFARRVELIDVLNETYVAEDMRTKDIFYMPKEDFEAAYEPLFAIDDYSALKKHIDTLNQELRALQKTNKKQAYDNRALRKSVHKWKQAAQKAQPLRKKARGEDR